MEKFKIGDIVQLNSYSHLYMTITNINDNKSCNMMGFYENGPHFELNNIPQECLIKSNG